MTLYTIIGILTFAVITPPAILAIVLGSFLDSSGDRAMWVARTWSRILLRACRVKVEIHGIEKIDPAETYVCAANHSSTFDILVLAAHLPFQCRWLAKEELFRIPVFGLALKRAGNIPVNRSNPRKSAASLKRAAEKIRDGASVVIFPEGTRSSDGRIAEFKRGGFTVAVKSGRPILPVSISGAHRIMPTKTLIVNPGTIKIVLGEPVPTHGVGRDEQIGLMDEVRRRIIANHELDYGQRQY